MPCRALEAFRPAQEDGQSVMEYISVLMPCRALEAFRHKTVMAEAADDDDGS